MSEEEVIIDSFLIFDQDQHFKIVSFVSVTRFINNPRSKTCLEL